MTNNGNHNNNQNIIEIDNNDDDETCANGETGSGLLQKMVTAVFQHESGIPGNYPGKAKRGFTKLATSGTQLEFPQFEKVGGPTK